MLSIENIIKTTTIILSWSTLHNYLRILLYNPIGGSYDRIQHIHIPHVVLQLYKFKFNFAIKLLSYICWNAKSNHHNRCIHTLTNSWLRLTLGSLIRSTHFLECSKRTSVPPHNFGLLGGKRLTFWQTIAPQLVRWNIILYLDTFHRWILTSNYLILLEREEIL